ncbi:hypothetical protein CIL05_07635 [Virgibacillus profundi]|uniref:Bacteriophage Mu Gam like protein n=1 Tax=Virgibacillus profundi TaxID=2024555 RepID=A0A2A2IGW5_9BACI|nr:host-nuclease inhibitor Gam family protein [Virgibacillus profundi]PAV30333.1 hypothetical protein CIL05_07635 [Virgibacillus profundi]PXY54505.1 hypothetical protein CIT14_07720 [Virgibacillus profundi]
MIQDSWELEVTEEEIENIDFAQLESWKVDKYIELVKENNETIKKYEEILEKRKAELDFHFKTKEEKLLKTNHFLLTTLNTYAKTQKMQKAKTQSKYTSLAGDIVIKQPQDKLVKPTTKDIEAIEKLYPEFVEKVETKKINWKDLKPKFVIQAGTVYDQETGEAIEAIKYETTEETTEVK